MAKRQRATRSRPGFTLMELLVVIAILGLLMVLVTPQVMRQFARAKHDTASLQIETLVSALEIFALDTGRYPSAEEGLLVLVKPTADIEGWNGPYLRKRANLMDPWGVSFGYRRLEASTPFEVYSFGSDKTEGGEGDARDLSSLDEEAQVRP